MCSACVIQLARLGKVAIFSNLYILQIVCMFVRIHFSVHQSQCGSCFCKIWGMYLHRSQRSQVTMLTEVWNNVINCKFRSTRRWRGSWPWCFSGMVSDNSRDRSLGAPSPYLSLYCKLKGTWCKLSTFRDWRGPEIAVRANQQHCLKLHLRYRPVSVLGTGQCFVEMVYAHIQGNYIYSVY